MGLEIWQSGKPAASSSSACCEVLTADPIQKMPKVDTRYALADAITTILTTNLQDMPEITCENCVQVHIKLKDLLKKGRSPEALPKNFKVF